MCGIIGYAGAKQALYTLKGLETLEYRVMTLPVWLSCRME